MVVEARFPVVFRRAHIKLDLVVIFHFSFINYRFGHSVQWVGFFLQLQLLVISCGHIVVLKVVVCLNWNSCAVLYTDRCFLYNSGLNHIILCLRCFGLLASLLLLAKNSWLILWLLCLCTYLPLYLSKKFLLIDLGDSLIWTDVCKLFSILFVDASIVV